MFNKKVIGNLFISFLVVIAIVLLTLVFSYDKLSISKVVPKVEAYQLDEEVKKEIEKENKEDEYSEIITTYELDASDLKNYEKTKEYNKGKKDPFAPPETKSENNTVDNNTVDSDNDGTNTTPSTNFYKDDGTK